MATRVLLATGNPGKLREMRRLAAGLSASLAVGGALEWLCLADLPPVPEAVEDGEDFAHNAELKALHYAAQTGLPALADDSGLEVDALHGAPGVHSARYAGEPRDDRRNNEKLLAALDSIAPERRTARFRCAMAFVMNGQVACRAQGAVEGRIALAPRGAGGFGYDPLFLIGAGQRSMAELDPSEKNSLSHRGRALRAILPCVLTALANADG